MVGGEEMFEEKEGRKKMEKDTVEIKIRFNKFWLERAIYIILILILIGLLFYNPFGSFACEKKTTEVTSTPEVSEPVAEVEEPEIEEEPVVEAEPESEPELEPEDEVKLSGAVGLTIGDIELTNGSKRIGSIWVYLDNDMGLFTPLIKVYWYGSSTPETVKNSVKYEYQYPSIIPIGRTNKKIDDEIGLKNKRALEGRYLNLEEGDKKATFKIEIYNANNKELLATKIKTISVS